MGLLLIPLITLGMHLLFMAAVYTAATLAALGHHGDTAMVIAVLMGLLFIVLGAFMRQSRPNWFVGVRTLEAVERTLVDQDPPPRGLIVRRERRCHARLRHPAAGLRVPRGTPL